MRKPYVVASLFVFALVTAACGGGGEEPSATTPPPAASPTETATGGATTRVALEDFFFDPADFSVTAGTDLELDNEGEAPHTFTVQGQQIDVEVAAGENGSATIDLPAGDYEVICRFHQGQGMVATMTVTE
ncbi:MAG TPA: cupredoxin domain-containing protein [Actinomycetota bacterium]|nr:cupredoxin domain-containing protein [Actinomycetota bacterium]